MGALTAAMIRLNLV